MATTKAKPVSRTAPKKVAPKKVAAKKVAPKKSASKVPASARAIGDAAVDLEQDIVAALRKEVKHLKATLGTIQKDMRSALDQVENALQAMVDAKPSANGKAPAKKAAAKKTAAKRRSK